MCTAKRHIILCTMSTTSWRETIKSNKFWHTLYAQFQSWPWTKLDFPWKAEAEPDMAASLVGPTKCQRQCHWKAHGCRGCTAALKRCPQEPPLWACRPRGVPETLKEDSELEEFLSDQKGGRSDVWIPIQSDGWNEPVYNCLAWEYVSSRCRIKSLSENRGSTTW